jgi:hypothetical protein
MTTPERRLAAAIVARAVRDARDGNGQAAEARRWLRSEYARNLLDGLDIHPDRASRWLSNLDPAMQRMLPGL